MGFLVLIVGRFGPAAWLAPRRTEERGAGPGWYRELYPNAGGRAVVGFWKRERNEHNFLCVHKSDPGHGHP